MSDSIIYVDLDHTITQTNTLLDTLFLLLKQKPWMTALLPIWLVYGKAKFKHCIASSVTIDPEMFLFREDVVAFLRQQKEAGRTIILATAADMIVARCIATRLGLFSEILASDGATNLIGEKKLEAMKKHAVNRPFEYIGDSRADLLIWAHAQRAHVVCCNPSLLNRLPPSVKIGKIFPHGRLRVPIFFHMLHPKIKNLLRSSKD